MLVNKKIVFIAIAVLILIAAGVIVGNNKSKGFVASENIEVSPTATNSPTPVVVELISSPTNAPTQTATPTPRIEQSATDPVQQEMTSTPQPTASSVVNKDVLNEYAACKNACTVKVTKTTGDPSCKTVNDPGSLNICQPVETFEVTETDESCVNVCNNKYGLNL